MIAEFTTPIKPNLAEHKASPIIRTWHVVALSKRSLSQAAEGFRYFMLEKGKKLLNEMFKTAKPKAAR